MWKSIKSAFTPSCVKSSKAKKETVQPNDHPGEQHSEKPKRSCFPKKRFLSFFRRNKSAATLDLVVQPAKIPAPVVIPEDPVSSDQGIAQSIENDVVDEVRWVFDIGWDVGAKPDDLSEVLASKKVDVLKDNYVAMGPYVNAQGITTLNLLSDNPIFISVQQMRSEGHKVAVVGWNIPSSPPVILFDLRSHEEADRIGFFKRLVCRFFYHFNGEIKKKTIDTGI